MPFVWDGGTIFQSSVLTLATDAGAVDLLGEVAGVSSYDKLADDAEVFELYGNDIRVASLEDLIRMKEEANRPKDQLHLLELRALRARQDAE